MGGVLRGGSPVASMSSKSWTDPSGEPGRDGWRRPGVLQITLSLSTRPMRGAALRGMPFTRGVASLSPSLERHA
jgi:hypothetical protein